MTTVRFDLRSLIFMTLSMTLMGSLKLLRMGDVTYDVFVDDVVYDSVMFLRHALGVACVEVKQNS